MANEEPPNLVIVFTRTRCIPSLKARLLLTELDIPFIDVNIDDYPEAEVELKKFVHGNTDTEEVGATTTPHLFFNERQIVGYDTLQSLTKLNTQWNKIIATLKTPQMAVNIPRLDVIDEKVKAYYTAQSNNKENSRHDWIPIEYEKLVSMMRKANLIKDNRVSLTKTYRNSFKGQDFIAWIMKEKKIRRSEALEVGQELVERFFSHQFDKDSDLTFNTEKYYQLYDDSDTGPLNGGSAPTNQYTRNLGEFNNLMAGIIQDIYACILHSDKKRIYIERLEDNTDFKHYITLIRETTNLDIEDSTLEERLAFFTNCYNMQLIHITYKYGIPSTIWQKRRYLYSVYYKIGSHLYSLQSILNGILRGNKVGFGMLWKPFGKIDQRKPYIIPDGEPLVHFAINTYTLSTPPIRAYSSENVVNEMHEAAQQLLETDAFVRIDSKKNVIHLHRLFKIYALDFGPTTEAVLEWIIEAMNMGPKRDTLFRLWCTKQYTVSYLQMDFTLNVLREESACN
uniref:DEP domain-containing protein n=1 Tax=Panagrellus redivivus TaxID=6233 RepID=A0A7E5A187_PANRE